MSSGCEFHACRGSCSDRVTAGFSSVPQSASGITNEVWTDECTQNLTFVNKTHYSMYHLGFSMLLFKKNNCVFWVCIVNFSLFLNINMLFYLIVAVFCPVLWNGKLELKNPKYFLRSCPLSQNFYLWLLVPWFPWLHTNWNMQWFPPQSQEHFLFLRKFGMGKVQGSLDVHQFGVPMQVRHATRSKNYNALLVFWAEMQPAWALKCYGSQVTESQNPHSPVSVSYCQSPQYWDLTIT